MPTFHDNVQNKGASLDFASWACGFGLPGDHEKKQLTPLYYVAIDKVMAAHARRSVVSFSFRVT